MLSRFLKSFLAFSLCAGAALAQPAPPAPTPTPTGPPKPKPAYVRFWNMTSVAGSSFDLVNDGAPQEPFSTAASRNYFAPYLPIAPGTYNFSIFKAGQRDVVLKKQPIALRSDVYVTILVSGDKAESPRIELLDDTWSKEKTPLGFATLRNFLASEARIKVAGKAVTIAPGGTQTVNGLPLEKVMFAFETTLPDGSARTWNAEADFKRSHRTTMLIFQDGRGGIRPRMTEDGVAPVGMEDDRATAAPTIR